MGAWGYKPLENDSAQDLLSEFDDSSNIAVLERSLDSIINLTDKEYLQTPEAEQAIAAAQIIRGLNTDKLKQEQRANLIEKSNRALRRILENSELKELWAESSEYKNWVSSVEALL